MLKEIDLNKNFFRDKNKTMIWNILAWYKC